MNIKQIQYVFTLSQEGSFSRAAGVLDISQPSLSQYIRNIEKQLGVELFERLNGEVKLTDAGKIYIDIGQKVLDLNHQLETQFSALSNYNTGTLTIGISPYRSVHMIPNVAKAFNQKYPNIKLIIDERSGNDLVESAEHGSFDLCVIAVPVDENIFNVVPIFKEEILIAVNRSTELYSILRSNSDYISNKSYPSVDISYLSGHSFAMLSPHMPMRKITDRLLKSHNITVEEKILVNSNEALLSIVDSGICASFVPSGLTNLISQNTALFSIKQETYIRDVSVIYRKSQFVSQPIKDIISIFKALF